MNFVHFLAQPVGWAARAVGGVQNALPGGGDSSLNQVGRAITSGTATLSHPAGLFTGAPAFTEATAPRTAALVGGGGGSAVLSSNTGGGAGFGYDANGNYVYGGAYSDPNGAARASWMGALGGNMNNIRSNAADAFSSGTRNLQGTAESLFNKVSQEQKGIDTSRENVELNRLNGVKDILTFVRNGLRQGGSRLANMNAGESSAAGEIARQFGELGSGRMRSVGNAAFLQNRDIDTKQDQVNLEKGQGKTDFSRARDDIVTTIGQQVRQQLADLDAQGRQLGANPGFDIEGEKQKTVNAGLAALNNVDAWLTQQLGGVNPEGNDMVKSNAVALQQGGTGDITPFDFSGMPGGMQVQGPAVDQLPLFTRTKKITAGA